MLDKYLPPLRAPIELLGRWWIALDETLLVLGFPPTPEQL